jgi:hypothetical protein
MEKTGITEKSIIFALAPVFPGSIFNPDRHQFFSKPEYLTPVTALQALLEPAVSIAINK